MQRAAPGARSYRSLLVQAAAVTALATGLSLPGTQARATGVKEAGSDSPSSDLPTKLQESIGRSRYEIVVDQDRIEYRRDGITDTKINHHLRPSAWGRISSSTGREHALVTAKLHAFDATGSPLVSFDRSLRRHFSWEGEI